MKTTMRKKMMRTKATRKKTKKRMRKEMATRSEFVYRLLSRAPSAFLLKVNPSLLLFHADDRLS